MPAKRTQVAAACQQCQRRKAKCSGERPSCTSCTSQAHECVYDVAIGTTRNQHVKDLLREVTTRLEGYELLVHRLLTLSDYDSTMLLAGVRLDCQVDRAIERLKAENENLPPSSRFWSSIQTGAFGIGDFPSPSDEWSAGETADAGGFHVGVGEAPYFVDIGGWEGQAGESSTRPRQRRQMGGDAGGTFDKPFDPNVR